METLPPTSYFFHLAASFFMLMKLLTFDTTPKKHHPLPCYHRFFPPKAVFFSDEVLKKTLYIYVFPGKKSKKIDFNFKDIYPGIEDMPRQCNINPLVFARLHEIFGRDKLPSTRQIFYYIYAILNSGIYRERYWDHLKIDFPRVPFTASPGLFMKLSGLGEVLADLHLMKFPGLDNTFSKFEVIGDNIVKKPLFKLTSEEYGRVYINDTQYFSNIANEIWEFEFCGYQVLKKWLMERRNRVLSPGEILHYIKICRAVQLTIDYHQQIDRLYFQLEMEL
jgi:hypothetical protein